MMNAPTTAELCGTVTFCAAVLHTFCVSWFQKLASRNPEGSMRENFYHLLGEVEVVFGLWAGILVLVLGTLEGFGAARGYVEKAQFTEPLFVFAIMAVAATRPVLALAARIIGAGARVVPLRNGETRFLFAALSIGPILGSFITEPAAMTVTALLLRDRFFARKLPQRVLYLGLGALFVNISIGGVLTPYAAPPVLMVAGTWGWDFSYMITHFGWKAALAVLCNSALACAVASRSLAAAKESAGARTSAARVMRAPVWLQLLHAAALGLIVINAHHPQIFIGVLLFFLGLSTVTREYQDELQLRQSLLVGFFLAGLVVFGQFQSWWLAPLIRGMDALVLFFGATALTAVTDNAALTFLGAQIPDVSTLFQHALVAGAVAGGGLTVIANAPNPAGFSLLSPSFGPEGIKPGHLFAGALIPTLVAMAWLLPLW